MTLDDIFDDVEQYLVHISKILMTPREASNFELSNKFPHNGETYRYAFKVEKVEGEASE